MPHCAFQICGCWYQIFLCKFRGNRIKNFVFEVIERVTKEETAYHAEELWEDHYRANGFTFYNMKKCGRGPIGFQMPDAAKRKLSKLFKGRPSPLRGIKRTHEFCKKISKAMSQYHSHLAKFDQEKVRQIRLKHAAGVSNEILAEYYGVSNRTIRDVALKRTWKYA